MSRTIFACPECGGQLRVSDSLASREIACTGCGAVVEVPYLPRDPDGPRRRSKRDRPPRALRIAWGLVALLAVVDLAGGINRYVQIQSRSRRSARVEALHASALSLEQAKNYDRAFIDAEAALSIVRSDASAKAELVARIGTDRDRIARLEFLELLRQVDQFEPGRALTECLTLAARVRSDRAIADLSSQVDQATERSRLRKVEAGLASAQAALNDGRASEALTRLEGALATSNELSGTDRSTSRQLIDEVANRLVATHGLLLSPPRGEFTLGSTASYDAALVPILLDAAKGRSFAPKPAKSPFLPLWDRLAPYRVEVDVTEAYTALYLQSKSRISTIQGKVKLLRGGEVYWQADLTGRTRVPVAGLPAYIASRLAVSDKVVPEAERRLYDDAFESFREQFGIKVRGLRPPARPGRPD